MATCLINHQKQTPRRADDASGEAVPSHLDRSGPSAPVFDAVMVGCEAVADAP